MQYNNYRRGYFMKKTIENIKFMQEGTLVFGDLYMEDGIVQRIDYKTPHTACDIAVPGFVDIHTHGFQAISCEENDTKKLKALACAYATRGITSFCATLSPRPLCEYVDIINAYRLLFQGDSEGAQFAGFHLEGPYITSYKGKTLDCDMQSIHLGELEAFLSSYHDDIRIMTIAPELPHAQEAIQLLNLYGVQVSLGHTCATFAQTQEAFSNGASLISHLGNAMPTIDHRKETMVDAIFLSDCTCEIIMDRSHLQKRMLRWIIQLLGTKRIIAVGDGSIYEGCDPTQHRSNALLGNCCDILDIFRYLYVEEQYELLDCMRMCSTNAAKLLKSYTTSIGLGKKVDITILDPTLQIKEVIINGRSSFRNE